MEDIQPPQAIINPRRKPHFQNPNPNPKQMELNLSPNQ